MDNNRSSPGFSSHVIDQLNQASQQISQPQKSQGRGRGRGRGRGADQARQYHQPAGAANAHQQSPPSIDSFPPLGAPAVQSPASRQPAPIPSQQAQPSLPGSQRNVQPRAFFDRTRGAHQSQQPRSYQQLPANRPPQYQPQLFDDFRRPPAPHGTLYQQNSIPGADHWSSASDQQRSFQQQVMAQADYLNRIQHESRNQYQLKHEEQVTKENFRKRLETFFQDVLSKQHPDLEPHAVRLKCYGSLNNGFGLAGCDMDLLLALPDNLMPKMLANPSEADSKPGPVTDARKPTEQGDDVSTAEETTEASPQENFAVGWLLEGALLDAGLGARLLTKTRVPILKVCERPSNELLQNLRQYRLNQMKPKTPTELVNLVSNFDLPPSLDMKSLGTALKSLEDQDTAAKVPLPEPPSQQPGASLEFEGDYGIKCDVNFSDSVAVHNTRLLREYCLYDSRVAQVGVFVKTWAKTRDINTPYWGTLSSYGYVLMVLHYLMNVVHPPVIPNLQHLAYNEDAWNPAASVELFEGKFDIRFLTDKTKIEAYRKTMRQNRDSTGNLIRGFFWYYSARDGFNWKNDIISIRTQGGILKKFAKGWTEAKWSEHTSKNKVRQRYLMAIEDPFETDHNIARVVGHNGIVAIRDEFRRAWDIIGQVGTGAPSEDLMQPVEARGDLLRKDQDHHKEKMRKMREALEAKERTLREAAAVENGQSQQNGTWSGDESPSFPLQSVPGSGQSPNSKLTRVSHYRDKPRQYSQRVRKVNGDDDSDQEDLQNVDSKMNDSKLDDVQSTGTLNVLELGKAGNNGPEPFCSAEELSFSMGTDAWGNLIAWDLGTQDGRWLQWRDNKIRQGRWSGVTRPDLAALHEACPFDAHRPRGDPSIAVNDVFPPYPLTKNGETSSTQSFNAKSHVEKSKQRKKKRKSNQQKAADANTSAQEPPEEQSTSANLSHPGLDPAGTLSTERPITNNRERILLEKFGPDPAKLKSTEPSAPEPVIVVLSQLTPPNEALAKTIPIEKNTVHYTKDRPDNVVQAPIKYNWRTNDGRWLQRRGAMVRSGNLDVTKLDEWEMALHLHFPYTPEMLKSKLEECNQELSKHWKTKPLGNSTEGVVNKNLEATKPDPGVPQIKKMISAVVTELKDLPREPQHASPSLANSTTCPHTLDKLSTAARIELTPSDATTVLNEETEEDMPNSAFVRSRRLAFFAQRQQTNTLQTDDISATDERTVKTLMREAGIQVRPQLTKKDSAIGIWASSGSENSHAKNHEREESLKSATAVKSQRLSSLDPTPKDRPELVDETDTTEAVGNNIHNASESQGEACDKVPSTRYPNAPVEERPRDEDPRIMPIPRQYGFKFDVRQLRDLAVIKEGGNGCARDGQEFEIEEDYEWGGGGEMGYKSTSGMRQSSASNREAYEYGKGDEDGLLDELPGLDD